MKMSEEEMDIEIIMHNSAMSLGNVLKHQKQVTQL